MFLLPIMVIKKNYSIIGMVIDIGHLKLKLEHLESTETMFIIIDNQVGTKGQGCTLQLYFLLLMWCPGKFVCTLTNPTSPEINDHVSL
jgi:hypothetical protein